jgi:hypothetical protein
MLAFPEIRVGEPLSHASLTVFPLFADSSDATEYLLSDEAIGTEALTVEEVNESGSVPNLLVDNQTDSLVLFLEGEELRGAKQNRVLNTSVLIAPKSRTTIPVSCVEQGRWQYRSRQFRSGASHSSSKLRHILKKSVTRSMSEGRGHSSDQGEVWQEVERQMSSLKAESTTLAMSDTYDTHKERFTDFRTHLPYTPGAVGLVVAIGNRIVSVDLFDRPTTCEKVWDRLLTGVVIDALEETGSATAPSADTVKEMINQLNSAPWKPGETVGAGEEFRAETGNERHASALTFQGAVVHGSLVMG